MNLSAINDKGGKVDWFFMYKISGQAKGKGVMRTSGVKYIYFDSSDPANAKLKMSPYTVKNGGALVNTLKQVYVNENVNTFGWFFYNDENPITGTNTSIRGHTKGVLAFDMASDTGFWLVQSTPKFPPESKYNFPNTGEPNAQTLLCVTLKDAMTARTIAQQMVACQQPSVYLASKVPTALINEPADARYKLLNNEVMTGVQPIATVIPFYSKAKTKFLSMAKNRFWNKDFYNDLVGPGLHDNLDVETWEHGLTPTSLDSDKVHTVLDMDGINLNPLGYKITWPEADDHAKLAISAASETNHFVCVGDMNFTLSMRERGGGTVAFQCEPLWKSLLSILINPHPHLKAGAKPR
jgi:deoxyribonuclease II